MTDWTEGYVAEIGYVYGYYSELNPLRARLALLNAGLHCPEFGHGCELGFGQGLSINVHAAASATQWHGTDFNPAQAGAAQELAAASGSGARLFDQAFAEFAGRSDLPDFDYIGLHGVWSWVSVENRAVIVDFIRRKLKVGGVLYVSYNTWPGWSPFAPLRHLMAQHAQIMGSEGQGIVGRIDGALEFAERLLATAPRYARANPTVADRLKKAKEQGRRYLAHEYFNRTWDPVHFAQMAESLAPAKVEYACSAQYLDHVDALNLSAEQQELLKGISHPGFRETVRDLMVDQQFRRDYWVKGPRRLTPPERAQALRAQKVLLIANRPDVTLKINSALRGAKVDEAICNPILDCLADNRPRSLQQVEEAVKDRGIPFPKVMSAVMVMIGTGHLAAAQEPAEVEASRPRTDLFNASVLERARASGEIGCLASPVTGGGQTLERVDMLFLLALGQGKKQPDELARSAWQILRVQGHKLVKEGKVLNTAEENLAELQARAQAFATKSLPVLKALQIA